MRVRCEGVVRGEGTGGTLSRKAGVPFSMYLCMNV